MMLRNGLWALTATVALAAPLLAQPEAPKPPEWVAAHDLKVRKGKDTDWDKALKLGVEVFKDPKTNAFMALSSSGSLAVVSGEALANKASKWASGLNLSVRTADEAMFTTQTQLIGAELFKNAFNGQVLYITEKNGIALFAGDAEKDKDPKFLYGLKLKVRKPGSQTFDADAKAYGLEAFRDNSTGGMLYITEAGFIATAKDTLEKPLEAKDVKRPKPLFGLECRVRKPEEADFTDKTQKFSIEVFKDENTGTLLYISDTGSIAAVPAPEGMKSGERLTWSHGMTLKARPGGELDFQKANKYGIEVFVDQNTNYVVYVTQAGTIAVLPRK